MSTKKEYLLVDGYNIIFAWDNLKLLAEEDLSHARDSLLEILSNYQGYVKNNLIVVFDAHKVKGIGSNFVYDNIFVVYTKEAETADQFIEKTVSTFEKGSIIRVATSDALEQVIIMSKGALRLSANDLKFEVEKKHNTYKEKYIDNKHKKSHMLIDRFDKDIVEWFEQMRRQ